ncbi:30S ribosomal protein S9 [Candidatus Woesearchaeota archaeon]|nr:30S ribosomal protein S9 [Candidatus Woesearchaeota archaeon]
MAAQPKSKVILTSGSRKLSIARATLRPGRGIVRVNRMLVDLYQPAMSRMKIMEPLWLAEDYANKVDIDVRVFGGGVNSSAEAARLAIARALVAFAGKDELKQRFLDYDRNMLVADVRYKETCKPNDSKARAKRQKSYR